MLAVLINIDLIWLRRRGVFHAQQWPAILQRPHEFFAQLEDLGSTPEDVTDPKQKPVD